jgi:small-conductance mechanosensitive channel
MQTQRRLFFVVLSVLLALTGAGLFLTSEWGNRAVSLAKGPSNAAPPPVNLEPFRNAQALAKLAATPEEQDLARDALRKADHEVDFAFAAALYQASTQAVPSTPEIKEILNRISKDEQQVAEMDAAIARLTKQFAAAKENEKEDLKQQLDLAKTRQELNEDELADADQDLERAGGDPQGRVQRMLDEYNASEQSSGGQLDLSIVGTQAGTTVPANNSFLSRVRALYPLHVTIGRLRRAQQDGATAGVAFSKDHDDLEHQLEQAQSEQSKKLNESSTSAAPGQKSAESPNAGTKQTSAAIASYRSLTALQKRLSGLDGRIRNQQDLANVYGQWAALAEGRWRGLVHALLVSLAMILVIGLAVLIADNYSERVFDRIEPDKRNWLTLRAVLHIATRAVGAILILLVIFGLPSQMATVLALAGAGLTVALKDFIVGFFGWFVLMGKDGIRHGDWVEINGVSGEVVEIGLFHTVLLETGNWNDSGHPTGRRVTFVNSYAIEGHYFNFSTTGQWLWEELQVALPADRDPYPVAEEIQKIVSKETEANAHLAEQEWERMGAARGIRAFSAGPAISVRPSGAGFEILVRYVTRANERHKQRADLYFAIVELLRRKNIPQPVAPASEPSAATAT